MMRIFAPEDTKNEVTIQRLAHDARGQVRSRMDALVLGELHRIVWSCSACCLVNDNGVHLALWPCLSEICWLWYLTALFMGCHCILHK